MWWRWRGPFLFWRQRQRGLRWQWWWTLLFHMWAAWSLGCPSGGDCCGDGCYSSHDFSIHLSSWCPHSSGHPLHSALLQLHYWCSLVSAWIESLFFCEEQYYTREVTLHKQTEAMLLTFSEQLKWDNLFSPTIFLSSVNHWGKLVSQEIAVSNAATVIQRWKRQGYKPWQFRVWHVSSCIWLLGSYVACRIHNRTWSS